MNPRLQRRIQRYGWDLAAADYDTCWQAQLAVAHDDVLASAALSPGDRVLDAACGDGAISFPAARIAGSGGHVHGIDISGAMIEAARQRAFRESFANISFERTDAESLTSADCSFNVALCSLGLMYLPNPRLALQEIRRVLSPGGRMVLAVWGERAHCGWADIFEIVAAEVESEVCPLFFRLGERNALVRLCDDAGFDITRQIRRTATLKYDTADAACDAVFIGGPVALAWSRFDAKTRERVRSRYLASIERWSTGEGYAVPAEFVVVAGVRR